MKRRALALGATLLLLGLMPGSALALPASNRDQLNIPPDALHYAGASAGLAQTFTAGKTGMLSRVDLYLGSDGPTSHVVRLYATDPSTGLPTGSSLAGAWVSVDSDPAWDSVSFAQPASVTSGVVYAIVIPATGNLQAFGSSDTYSGGKAYTNSAGWTATIDPAFADLGFVTYVDTVTTQLAWDKASVTAGVATPLTLTATMTFANGAEASKYSAILSALPSWFSAPGLTCSALVATGDCTSDKLSGVPSLLLVDRASNGATLTFTLTETVTPPLAAVGTSTVTGEACLVYPPVKYTVVHPNAPGDPGCADGSAAVQVVAPAATPTPPPAATPTPTPTPFQSLQGETLTPTQAVTLPPTSSGAGSGSDGTGSTIWLLPIGLLAFLGGALALVIRRRRLA